MPGRVVRGIIGSVLALMWTAAVPGQAQDPPALIGSVLEPLRPPFLDDFHTPNIDPLRWSRAVGAGQAESGLRLDGAGQPPPRMAELCTAPINLEQLGPVKVGVIATPLGSKTAAPLVIEYLSSGGDWRELRRAPSGPALPPGGLYLDTLPADGLHRLARVRFRVEPGAEAEGWNLREVAIVPARLSLTVACRLEGAIEIGLTPADLLGRTGGSGALMRFFEEPAVVTLSAPVRTARQVFEHWEIGGKVYPAGQNVVTRTVDRDLAVLAEYVRLGDLNGDGLVDRYDLDAFVLATVNPQGYAERYPELDRLRRGDMNGDGMIDELDIEPFVERLLSP